MMPAILLAGMGLMGCASDGSGGNMTDRQEKAMKDPFGYTPEVDTDVSGGGVGNFNHNGMGKDLSDVFNP
jgi:hypothetical protein